MLANVSQWEFPEPNPSKPIKEDVARFPLRKVWEKWLANRPKTMRDKDGLELVRAYLWCHLDETFGKSQIKQYGKEWSNYLKIVSGDLAPPKRKHASIAYKVLEWLLRLHPPTGAMDFLLDTLETAFASVPKKTLARVVNVSHWQERPTGATLHPPILVRAVQPLSQLARRIGRASIPRASGS